MNTKEQFEAWFMDKYDIAAGVLNYASPLVSQSWTAWQAASKASEQKLSESRREFTAANATIHNLELQLADAEARGVELLKEHVNKWMLDMDFPSDMQFEHAEFTLACDEFAAQLRQGEKS